MMITNFALLLSVDGIELLHRVPRGWRRIGRTDVASETLAADLADMRDKAAAMVPDGLRTKLVIPADQIKYTAIDSTLTTLDDIHETLEGATPYALDELVIDFERFGGRTHIAAVARETLDEAEAFARAHGFNPVSFVAISEPFTFQREVFFGPSKMMPDLLGPGGSVAADAVPVMIVGTRLKSRLLVFDLPDDIKDQAEREDLADLFAAKIDAAEALQRDVGEIAADVTAPKLPLPDLQVKEPVDEPAQDAPEAVVQTPSFWVDRVVAEYHAPVIAAPKVPLIPQSPVFADLPLFDPVIAESHSPAPKSQKAPLVALARKDTVPAAKAAPAANRPNAPLSQRNKTPMIAASIAACALLFGGLIWSQMEPAAPVETVIAVTPVPTEPAAETQIADQSPAIPDLAVRDFATALSGDSSLPAIAPYPSVTRTPTPEALLTAAPDDLPSDMQPPPAAPEQRTAQATPDAPEVDGVVLSPAEADSIYQATGVWQRAPRFFAVPTGVIVLDFAQPAVLAAPERIAQPQVPQLEGLDTDLSFIPPADPPAPGVVFARDAEGFILATPEGTLTPEGALVFAGLPDLTVTARPTLSQEDLDRMALLAPAPEGVVIIAGTPAVVPPLRPADAALPPREPDATTAGATVTPGSVGLAGLELQPSGTVGLDTDAVESGAVDDLRPQLRPQGLSAAASNDTPDITTIIAGIEAEDATLRFDNSTNLAVTASLRPAPRPGNFGSIVASARPVVPETQAAAAVPTPPPAAAPVEPQNFAPVPGGVARAATQEDAIRLRDINLIGVYGRPNARRALVRLGNGRYVRVEVGSELDGGQVTAIGDAALNYVKRGRTYAIELPAG